MSSAFRALGSIDHFIRPFGQSGFNYLGTAVTSPLIKEGDKFLPIFNDIGGRSVPTQMVTDRRMAMVVTTINRFNWTTYNVLRSMRGTPGSAYYEEQEQDHGVPVLGAYDIDLLLTFSFGSTFSAETPNGRLYYGGILKDWDENSVGSRVMELTLTFELYGQLDAATRKFRRYTEDSSAWGSVTRE
jgi:hypothetical protein